jgi:4-aminobutyrate aminotransferase / (S)-3-amino-2-methylpropionate transaminase / 5-aminovalerate transaminase
VSGVPESLDGSARASLLDLAAVHVPGPYLQHHPIFANWAEDAWLTDTEGRRYLDFSGGISVLNVGHRNPTVVSAVSRQLERLMHVGPVMLHPGYVELAAAISRHIQDGPFQVLFVNSGAEAIENAVKVARHATGRSAVVAFENSYHGRTLLTSTLTGKIAPYKMQPGALAPEIFHAPYPNPFRPPAGVDGASLVEHALDALERLLVTQVPPDKVAAIIAEPIQGEGGYVVPPPGFLAGVEAVCRRIGALLIVDEIQTGYWRTGKFLGYEWEGISPDVIALGKSIGGGLPLAAVAAKRAVFDKVLAGDVGGTYGGNPLACAAGLAVLDVLERHDMPQVVATIEDDLRQIRDVASDGPFFGEFRGRGAMYAIEFVEPGDDRAPRKAHADALIDEARRQGLIVIRTGHAGNAVRLLPPLISSAGAVSAGVERFLSSLRAVDAGG